MADLMLIISWHVFVHIQYYSVEENGLAYILYQQWHLAIHNGHQLSIFLEQNVFENFINVITKILLLFPLFLQKKLFKTFLLQTDFIGTYNCDTFSQAPSTINDNLKTCCSISSNGVTFHPQKTVYLTTKMESLWRRPSR